MKLKRIIQYLKGIDYNPAPPSQFNKKAKISHNPKYKCPKCGSATFADGAAVWCRYDAFLENGNCDYHLMTG